MSGLKDMLELLRRRDRALLRRGIISGVDDTGAAQRIDFKGIFGLIRKGVETWQQFGFTSNPPIGAECVQIQVNGDPANPIVIIAFDRRYRITGLQPGESLMFNMLGDFVKLDQNRNATIQTGGNVNITAATKVTVTAPNAEFTQNVKIDGNLTVGKLLTCSSSVSFAGAGKKVTAAATVQVLITTVGDLKVAGVPVSAP